jgi:hypothetical protein
MIDHIEINLQNWEERATIHARDTTGDYMLDRFRAGEDSLHAIEAVELGNISREWIHSLSAVLGGLIDVGLTITMFHEHEVLPWRGLPILVPASDRLWRLPAGYPRIPLSYSLRAKKIA